MVEPHRQMSKQGSRRQSSGAVGELSLRSRDLSDVTRDLFKSSLFFRATDHMIP